MNLKYPSFFSFLLTQRSPFIETQPCELNDGCHSQTVGVIIISNSLNFKLFKLQLSLYSSHSSVTSRAIYGCLLCYRYY